MSVCAGHWGSATKRSRMKPKQARKNSLEFVSKRYVCNFQTSWEGLLKIRKFTTVHAEGQNPPPHHQSHRTRTCSSKTHIFHQDNTCYTSTTNTLCFYLHMLVGSSRFQPHIPSLIGISKCQPHHLRKLQARLTIQMVWRDFLCSAIFFYTALAPGFTQWPVSPAASLAILHCTSFAAIPTVPERALETRIGIIPTPDRGPSSHFLEKRVSGP